MILNSVDISSLSFSQNPYKYYDLLRTNGNVHYLSENNTWLIIGFNQIVEILTNTEKFTSEGESSFDPILLNCDPPKHTQHRRVLASGKAPFSSNRIDQFEKTNRKIAENILLNLKDSDSFDLLKDFSLPYSTLVILSLLGISTDTNEALRTWSLSAVSTKSIYNATYAGQKWEELKPIVQSWIKEIKSKSEEQGLAEIIFHSYSKENFSDEDILNLTKVLLLGGNETTPNLISSALLRILNDKKLHQEIKVNPTLIENVINETLRIDAPTQIIQRTSTQDVVIEGNKIKKGSLISLAIGAANRDPEVFKNPSEFDLNRVKTKILSFGFGPHYCIGAHLAKQEARVGLELILNSFPDLRLATLQQFKYRHSSHIRGLVSLIVTTNSKIPTDLKEVKKKAVELIEKEQLPSGEFPTYEYYPNTPELEKKGWHIADSSPFVHSNIVSSLMNLKSIKFSTQIEEAVEFIMQKKETGDVWRFWEIGEGKNNVPADIDDTAICSLVLKQRGIKLNNVELMLGNEKNGIITTWFLPKFNNLFSKVNLTLKWWKERKYYQPTINSNMLSPNDYELGVIANALAYLGENEKTTKAIEHCIETWKTGSYNQFFYSNEIVISFHLARAYFHGVSDFNKLEGSIITNIQSNCNTFDLTELILSGLILKYFNSNSDLRRRIKGKIIEITGEEGFKFPHFPYFTSKDRNYIAGSNCLVASWFLELSEEWV